MPDFVVEMKAIEKSFNRNKVLHRVDFSLERGSIHALLGENGTGKSTLMNILGGILSYDKGEVFVEGKKVTANSPSISKRLGIAFIHQELTLVNDLTVYENLFLGRECKKGLALDKKSMIKGSAEVLKQMDIDLDPCTCVGDLDASYKQIVEIARALVTRPKLLLLDEPAAGLTAGEVDELRDVLLRLHEELKLTMVVVEHNMRFVMKTCSDLAVLSFGRKLAQGSPEEVANNDAVLDAYLGGVL